MEQSLSESSKSAQFLHEALSKANIKGLHDMVQINDDGSEFLLVLPDFADGDRHCPNNIFIDVEEWNLEGNKTHGEFTLHYGFGHTHYTYGDIVGPGIEKACQNLIETVQGLLNNEIYSYYLISPIGFKTTGYRHVLDGLPPKLCYESDLIMDYYYRNIYKEGMSEFPESEEQYIQIIEELKKANANTEIRTLVFSDKKPTVGKLFE